VLTSSFADDLSGPIWLDNLGCSRDHAALEDCPHGDLGVHNCGHSEDVGVKCMGSNPSEAKMHIRL